MKAVLTGRGPEISRNVPDFLLQPTVENGKACQEIVLSKGLRG